MTTSHLNLNEEHVVKIILEFLEKRNLHISQVSLERESGVINGCYGDDLIFLRQLIIDGQWDDLLKFIQPIEVLAHFNKEKFYYFIMKQKYLELVCIKSEADPYMNMESVVQQIIQALSQLENCCSETEEYSELCSLLTLPNLMSHKNYKNWNPISGRIQCFKSVLPLVDQFMPTENLEMKQKVESRNDRLMQLIIKGILYESCVDFCQQRATQNESDKLDWKYSTLLKHAGFSESDLSLVSWLKNINLDVFFCPFESCLLNVDVQKLERPDLETSWTEQILITPIKPNIFPHSAITAGRTHSAYIMSRSLLDCALVNSASRKSFNNTDPMLNDVSENFASFHLTGKKPMDISVDKLFEEGDVILSSSLIDSFHPHKSFNFNPLEFERTKLMKEYQHHKISKEEHSEAQKKKSENNMDNFSHPDKQENYRAL